MSLNMSLHGETEVYRKMFEAEVDHHTTFMDCDKSPQFVLISAGGKSSEELMVVGEEVEIEEDMVNEETEEEVHTEDIDQSPIYFEEALDTCEEVTVDYNEPPPITTSTSVQTSSVPLRTDFKIKQEWHEPKEEMSLHLECEDDDEEQNYPEEELEVGTEDGEDEETIATFVTAAGQQLALYSVEDSDEIFAVAVYDETGEPPSNFQFLMKSDVERLIGEGAVRTVKKPTQIKRQLLTTQPPLFTPKQESVENNIETEKVTTKSPVKNTQSKRDQSSWSTNANINPKCETMLSSRTPPRSEYSSSKQSNVAYLMMGENDVGAVDQNEENHEEVFENDNEIVEQSTVQYILLEGDQSDSELTFDEIQATLQNLKSPGPKPEPKKTPSRKAIIDRKTNGLIIMKSATKPVTSVKSYSASKCSQNLFTTPMAYGQRTQPNFSPTKQSSPYTSIAEKRRFVDGKDRVPNTVLQNTPASPVGEVNPDPIDMQSNFPNAAQETQPAAPADTSPKIKRSRKQQLTSVNRGDSEIIIQSASLLNEEENTNRKRGRRKKKPVTDPDYNPRPVRSKKAKKMPKHKKVEVINIDVDEEQSTSQAKKHIIEITIDDNKEKGSSDKENEVIMVGDSDDESQETPTKSAAAILQCEYCLRSFRQQRALGTHCRVCPKSPLNVNKPSRRKVRASSTRSNANDPDAKQVSKKQYTCKVCHEIFDAVVALARHARREHSQRKYKGKVNKPVTLVTPEKPTKPEVKPAEKDESPPAKIRKKKKSQSPNRAWKVKNLDCSDCGRWFPSAALLAAHCLQHATKNSEKQIRRCQTCNKLLKSRLLYVRHMKMHSRGQMNSKPLTHVLQKKLRHTRQVAQKIAPVRKRGRPRKL